MDSAGGELKKNTEMNERTKERKKEKREREKGKNLE